MAETAEQRGTLLPAVMIRSPRWLILIWSVIVGYVVIFGALSFIKGRIVGGGFVGVVFPLLTYVLYPRLRFFDGGVEIPSIGNNRRRFLRWDQIDRYSWDGDKLVLSGTNAVLSGGPAEGDVVSIPPSKRAAVERILARKVVSGLTQ
jgi:hypothetical protein